MSAPGAATVLTASDFPKLSALPIINIAPYLTTENKSGRLSVASSLHAACLEYGFFYLDYTSYVDPSEPEELTELARKFFAQSQEEKEKIALRNEDGARGYARLKENVTKGKADNHEGVDLYRPVENPDKTKPLWGENQWPEIPGFKEKYNKWIEKMKKLGMIIMEAMADGLGMTKDEWEELKSQVDDSFWVMRVIGYPPLPNDHDGFSCGEHKDYGCLTLLYADPTHGALEVFLQDTGHVLQVLPDVTPAEAVEDGVWIKADPIPGCIVCNVGEMWEIWSNGLYKSTLHRVVHRGSNYRIPFFFEPNFDALVKPLAAAARIQEGDPKVEGQIQKTYQPVVYGEFLLGKVGSNFDTGRGKYD
ncbi:Clavaminate synthase-like protein [Cytidiella melzeri]|nr:Clavaminate synthase-like protein [Cytidiella melzeri]